jgi:Sorting nexin 8/Mvp1 BAR domain
LSIWRKSASIPLVEEFTDRELPADLESRIPAELEDQLERVRQTLTPAINIYMYLQNPLLTNIVVNVIF